VTPCANDPRFTSDDPGDRAEAAVLCGGCAVAASCLAGARARGETWNVWGGEDMELRAMELAEPIAWVRPQVFAPIHNRARYASGCRCDACTKANAAYQAGYRDHGPTVTRPETLDLFEQLTLGAMA
jgi:hypothetical protein